MNAAMSKPLVLQFLGRSDLGVFRACRKYKHVGFVGHENTLRFAQPRAKFSLNFCSAITYAFPLWSLTVPN
jgi:hypothetical protein